MRFFVDCLTAEQSFFQKLSTLGKRCENREFFLIDKTTATTLLEQLYRKQHLESGHDERDFGCFEASANECFRKLHALNHTQFAEQTVRTLEILPGKHRRSARLSMLAHVVAKRDECFATWLVKHCGVDPEEPLQEFILPLYIRDYYLTAHELALYFQLKHFERYLDSIGCDIRNSSALCYVIDALINANINEEAQDMLVQFGTDLIKRGVNVECILNVPRFIEAPIATRSFRFDLFPRNSNQRCVDVIETLAPRNEKLARLYQALS
jgi:hypothetical protein